MEIKGSEISLETAVEWVNAWKNRTDISGNDFIASKIPMEDANRILRETGATALRGYNGYDEANGFYKLILVGINEKGEDIIGKVDHGTTRGSKIYDLTLPCPNTCCVESPLFTGKLP